jgi:serine/threonine-protein kinase HipA
MNSDGTIWVYADWLGMSKAECIGRLTAKRSKNHTTFGFEYETDWLRSENKFLLDPDIEWFSGVQYPSNAKSNFGIFLDSMPDRWGRTLMQRDAHLKNLKTSLSDIDFLLGVSDKGRMGALRFKTNLQEDFVNQSSEAIPPWASIRELQAAVKELESEKNRSRYALNMRLLLLPGSSLGGARPKANITDEKGELWIAKFPSNQDTVDKGAWEYLTYQLAVSAGIKMAECRIEKTSKHHTFLTKRFDRQQDERLHFASAMTMLGKNEELLKTETSSYLQLVDFIEAHCDNVEYNLSQLWRRIVFNMAVSNTDDHLRNHGFLLENKQWHLSPAYDMNPSIDRDYLSLSVDLDNSQLDFDLAKSVGDYFRLNEKSMNTILDEVKTSVSNWSSIAKTIGISRSEQKLMQAAFRV